MSDEGTRMRLRQVAEYMHQVYKLPWLSDAHLDYMIGTMRTELLEEVNEGLRRSEFEQVKPWMRWMLGEAA